MASLDRSLIAVVSPFGAFRYGSRRYALILRYLVPLCSIRENEFRELLLFGQSRFVAKGLWYGDVLSYYCVRCSYYCVRCILLFFDLVVLLHNNFHFGYTSIENFLDRSPMLSPTFFD